jgi:hypothetical protein
MKTKLAFLALPLSVGLVLTFVLAACDTGNAGNKPGDSSSSSAPYVPQSSGIVDDNINITGFVVSTVGTKINIALRVNATQDNPVRKVQFINTEDWILYNETPTREISFTEQTAVPILNLSGKLEIDLTNASIPCGTRFFSIRACIKDGTDDKGCAKTQDESFTKPESFCLSSSSEVSSSSEAGWKFGGVQSISVPDGGEGTMGSAKFRISETEDGASLTMTSGDIRDAGVGKVFDFDNSDEGPMANKEYPNSKFKDMGTAQTKIDFTSDYYLVSFGSEKYLMVTKTTNTFKWPKDINYWAVTQSP